MGKARLIGKLIMKCNELVKKHNALDIAFWEERRALQDEIKWLKEEMDMMQSKNRR